MRNFFLKWVHQLGFVVVGSILGLLGLGLLYAPMYLASLVFGWSNIVTLLIGIVGSGLTISGIGAWSQTYGKKYFTSSRVSKEEKSSIPDGRIPCSSEETLSVPEPYTIEVRSDRKPNGPSYSTGMSGNNPG